MIDISSLTKTEAWALVDEGDGIFRLVFDLPGEKVNKLTEAVLVDLEKILQAVSKESDVKALIVCGGKEESDTFIAGADINEIRGVSTAEQAATKAARGQAVLDLLASIPAVTVAAIHGNCLGGGTELALACDLRVASLSDATKIGLPEVNLGIIPGFGGTQRLPRLIGIERAFPLILTGRPVDARKAGRLGVVDSVVYPDLLIAEAKALANRALDRGGKRFRPSRPRLSLRQRLFQALPPGRALLRRMAKKNVVKVSGGHYPAPLAAVDAVIDGFRRSLKDGLALEAQVVGRLIVSPECRNLIDLFLSQESVRRGSGEKAAQAGSSVIDVDAAPGNRRAAVLGAGVMGGGIATLLARKGYRVRMKDVQPQAIQIGLKSIDKSLSTLVRKRRMSKADKNRVLSAITTTLKDDGLGTTSVVIEAVVEKMSVKQDVFRALEDHVPEDALLCSNTSALSITEMQSVLRHPERLVGLHFFNPVHRMPLVEVIPGEQSSSEYVAAAEKLTRQLGKYPVRVADRPGFLVNRLLACYLNEASHLFVEGFSPTAIDAALKSFGMPMGPFELIDEVGLDVAAKVAATLVDGLGSRMQPPDVTGRLVEEGKLLGKKSGAGFYLHRGGKKILNERALSFAGRSDGSFESDQPELWLKRLVYPIINEAAMALDEGVVASPALLDLAMVMGTGFAPFRGGPLRYADSIGAKQVCDDLTALKHERFTPCSALERLASKNQKFYDLECNDVVHA